MILAIDPGNVTGIAMFDPDHPDTPPTVKEIPGGLFGFVDWWVSAWAWLNPPTQVYCEDFIIRPDTHRKTREPAAYEIIGYVKGHCHEFDWPCTMIGPSEHTPFTEYKKKTKSKIVRLGWSAPSKDMHADSASSVLLVGLGRTHPKIAHALLKGIVND